LKVEEECSPLEEEVAYPPLEEAEFPPSEEEEYLPLVGAVLHPSGEEEGLHLGVREVGVHEQHPFQGEVVRELLPFLEVEAYLLP